MATALRPRKVSALFKQRVWKMLLSCSNFLPPSRAEIFVHMKGCIGTLPNAGDIVKFDIEPSPSKPGQYRCTHL